MVVIVPLIRESHGIRFGGTVAVSAIEVNGLSDSGSVSWFATGKETGLRRKRDLEWDGSRWDKLYRSLLTIQGQSAVHGEAESTSRVSEGPTRPRGSGAAPPRNLRSSVEPDVAHGLGSRDETDRVERGASIAARRFAR